MSADSVPAPLLTQEDLTNLLQLATHMAGDHTDGLTDGAIPDSPAVQSSISDEELALALLAGGCDADSLSSNGSFHTPPAEDYAAAAAAAFLPINPPRRWVLWTDKWKMANGSPVLDACWQVGALANFEEYQNFVAAASPIIDQLEVNSGLHLSLEGVRPFYTDVVNRHGGHFAIRLCQGDFRRIADCLWRLLTDAVVRETLPHSDHVTGVKIVHKPQSASVQLWIRDSKATETVNTLKDLLFHLLGPQLPVCFCPHRCILRTMTQKRNPRGGNYPNAPNFRIQERLN